MVRKKLFWTFFILFFLLQTISLLIFHFSEHFFPALLFSLLSSFFVTFIVVLPICRLRKAFQHILKGDFSIRLLSRFGFFPQDFKKLAQDFDAMNEYLQSMMATRETLLHEVSHELRTPLARLQLAIGLAQQNSTKIERSLKRIELEAQKLDNLLSEILTFSRLDSMQEILDEYFDLITLLKLVIDDANFEAQHAGIMVSLTVEDDARDFSIIHGNAKMVHRAIENIVRNAVHHSEPHSVVNIALLKRGNRLQISIRDFGGGVNEIYLSRIFEPFFKIQNSGKGYGLGLAIAKKAIIANKGEIFACNVEGGGLCVTILLPFWQSRVTDSV